MSGAFAGQRAVVAGFGLSGRAAARVLLEEGAEVRVSEAKPQREVEALAHVPGAEVLAGGHAPEHLEGATLLVLSPGVPERAPIVRWARRAGIPVWSELELGARLVHVPFVAVTGTNGKSTTVEMVAGIMRASGLAVSACGNLGHPFSLAARSPADALVVEVSSFQLRFQESLHPRVSVLLNLAPDHLDWHGSYRAYAAAKARIYLRQGPQDAHVGNRDDTEAAGLSAAAPCPVRWFGSVGPGLRPGPGDVSVVGHSVVAAVDPDRPEAPEAMVARLPDAGRALLLDAAAAAAAALAFGIGPNFVRTGLEAFRPLPHRGRKVAEVDGVRFVDDSKATNPHAALAAMEGQRDVVLIAGGLAKGVDLSPLASAAAGLRGVVAIGQAAPELARVFDDLVPVSFAGSMDEAVASAFRQARPGGTVLLAPACASQDMFRDYAQRGERFAEGALALVDPGGEASRDHAVSSPGGARG